MQPKNIEIKGLNQNNLKNISLSIPKNKIVVFTGVSGSGKSSIVFDTIAAESQRQMNETYPAFVRNRMPKYERAKVDFIDNLTASVIVDQSRLGGNARSTVGTICDLYSILRVLYSRIGEPFVGTSSFFSFNSPNGMCPECSGMGKVLTIDIDSILLEEESFRTGMINYSIFQPGKWYYKQYEESHLFDMDKKLKDYSEAERNLLLFGAYEKGGEQINEKVEGVYHYFERLLLKRDIRQMSDFTAKKMKRLLHQKECGLCHGRRLNEKALSCKVAGYSISEMCEMEFVRLRDVLGNIHDERGKIIVETMIETLGRMIEIGLPYLSLNRESQTLSGGEAQRLKLVRYMGSALTDMTYIFDEPSTGMHPRDVHRMAKLLQSLRDKGNTVLVVEHDKDIIGIADEVIDVGPKAGKNGGQILFQGSYRKLLESGTVTGMSMKEKRQMKDHPRKPVKFLPVNHAKIHNLKNISVDIPLDVLTVVTGVAGSGKSSLIRDVFAKKYQEQVVLVDQSPIIAKGNSTTATYMEFFDRIRKLMANVNQVEEGLFSFNSTGACPVCKGRGLIITELVFMDAVTTVCEGCNGKRYSEKALSYLYKGKNIVDILDMTVEEAADFFKEEPKIKKQLKALSQVGLHYLTLGQPLSTLSGGERQRIKLAKQMNKSGNIYVLDEPTTGLHASDIDQVMELFDKLVCLQNTVIIIEHNLDVMKQADYIIDIGPGGGTDGGEVVFTGTPLEMVENANTITAKYLKESL